MQGPQGGGGGLLKRIMHVIDTTGPGGAETIYVDLIRGLDPTRWQSFAVLPGPGWVYDTLRRHGIQPILAPPGARTLDVRYLSRLVSLGRRLGVDLIQTHLLGPAVYGGLASIALNVPVVSTFHGLVDVGKAERWLWWKRRIVRWGAGRTVFVSNWLRERLEGDRWLGRERTRVIPNGIDTTHFSREAGGNARADFGIGEGEVLITALGNVRRPKAYDVLLDAAGNLRHGVKGFRVIIAGEGDGELLEQLLLRRAGLGLEDMVHFVGFQQDVARLLRGTDILVSTSSSEGFSLSTVQALSCQVPVVATRSGGPEEIITDGVHGFLVDTGRPDQVAAALERLIRDALLRRQFGLAGRQLVERRFTIGTMIAAYQAVYDECCAGRRRFLHRRAIVSSLEGTPGGG